MCVVHCVHIEGNKEMREIQLGLWVLIVIDKKVHTQNTFESPKFDSFQVDRSNTATVTNVHTHSLNGGFCDKNDWNKWETKRWLKCWDMLRYVLDDYI